MGEKEKRKIERVKVWRRREEDDENQSTLSDKRAKS